MSILQNPFTRLLVDGEQVTHTHPLPSTALTASPEVAAYAYDQVIAEVGLGNILALVPGWESEGNTLHDLINPDIKFIASEPDPLFTNRGADLLHPVVHMATTTRSPKFTQAPDFSADTGGAARAMSGPTDRIAQKITGVAFEPGFITTSLRSPSGATGQLRLAIHSDSSGSPGDQVAVSDEIDAASLTATFTERGFVFEPGVSLAPSGTVWLVLEFNGAGSGTVEWEYDSGGVFGRGAASSSGGAWTQHVGHDQKFAVYRDDLRWGDDFTLICMARNEASIWQTNRMFGPLWAPNHTEMIEMMYHSSGQVRLRVGATGVLSFQTASVRRAMRNEPAVWALSYTSANRTVRSYLQGRLVAQSEGGSTFVLPPLRNPLVLGGNWVGAIGPWIVARGALADSQIANITAALLLRNRFFDG